MAKYSPIFPFSIGINLSLEDSELIKNQISMDIAIEVKIVLSLVNEYIIMNKKAVK